MKHVIAGILAIARGDTLVADLRARALSFLVLPTLLVVTGIGCSGSDPETKAAECAVGSESCACDPESRCLTGLDCRSNVCVALGAGGSATAGGNPSSAGTPPITTGGSAPSASKENGQLCATAAECASGICSESRVGEAHCYGDQGPDEICRDTYDCAAGLCIARSLTGDQFVCNVGITVCIDTAVSEQCTQLISIVCMLIQSCGSNVSAEVPASYQSLDMCIGSECTIGTDLTPAECTQRMEYILSGDAPCP